MGTQMSVRGQSRPNPTRVRRRRTNPT